MKEGLARVTKINNISFSAHLLEKQADPSGKKNLTVFDGNGLQREEFHSSINFNHLVPMIITVANATTITNRRKGENFTNL